MPVSEDEIDTNFYETNNRRLTKAEHRKNNKPLIEKRRRTRINQYIDELKTLILDATNKDPSRHAKLEKADILEMTVKHLQSIQRQQLAIAIARDPNVLNDIRAGFSDCVDEVSNYIDRSSKNEGVKERLVAHLTNFVSNSTNFNQPKINSSFRHSEDMNNNNHNRNIIVGYRELMKSIPASANNFEISNPSLNLHRTPIPPSRISAFTTVSKEKKGLMDFGSPVEEVTSTSSEPINVGKSDESIKKFPPQSLLIPVTELCSNPFHFAVTSNENKREKQFVDPKLMAKPLTIYTDFSQDDCNNMRLKNEIRGENPIDFSSKKINREEENLLTNRCKKRPFSDIPCNIAAPLPKLSKPSNLEAEDLSVKASTMDSEKDNMWRPW